MLDFSNSKTVGVEKQHANNKAVADTKRAMAVIYMGNTCMQRGASTADQRHQSQQRTQTKKEGQDDGAYDQQRGQTPAPKNRQPKPT